MTKSIIISENNNEILDQYTKSGYFHRLAGTTPAPEIQKIISSDPKKSEAFIQGATKAELEKENCTPKK